MIQKLSKKLQEGRGSSQELVRASLEAIAANDKAGKGLNTVAELDPSALFYARQADEEIAKGHIRSPLHGLPVLLKDNIDVKGLHTTAGSLALADLIAHEDASITKKLREAGAIILGKATLSEFAYFMSRKDMPSGYSSLHGQVIHAYQPKVNPLGSSSGSAVAVSARFVPFSIGSETDGSLMSPGIVNQICSIKPTLGLVSRQGILPLSSLQDTAGPMATSVADLAQVLKAIAGPDPLDPATLSAVVKDYPKEMKKGAKGLRIGIYGKNPKNREVLEKAREILSLAGAEVKVLSLKIRYLSEMEALLHEFKHDLNVYLSSHQCACRSLSDIIAFNKAHAKECLRYGQDILEDSDKTSGFLTEPAYIQKRQSVVKEARDLLEGTLEREGLDILLSAGGGPAANLAPISGDPCLCLPAKEASPRNFKPLGYYLMGGPYSEDKLLRVGHTLEKGLGIECIPGWVKQS